MNLTRFYEKEGVNHYTIHGFIGYVVYMMVEKPWEFWHTAKFTMPGFFVGSVIGNVVSHDKTTAKQVLMSAGIFMLLLAVSFVSGAIDCKHKWLAMLGSGITKPIPNLRAMR
jgi:uncharacterized membrane protein YjjB (DUF3815 family)